MSSLKVCVVAFEGVSLFHLSVPSMVLGAGDAESSTARYELSYCAARPGKVRCDQGLTIDVPDGMAAMVCADIVIVPAWTDSEMPAPAELIEGLRQAHARGALIVGLCLGTFVLGDAGLLDGREATTHWVAREVFARRFPRARFRPNVLYVADDNVITSAGGTGAPIDSCLHLLRQRHGADEVQSGRAAAGHTPASPGGTGTIH